MSRRNAPDWNRIGCLYEGGEIAVAGICARFAISKTALYRRARRMGWRMRRDRECCTGPAAPPATSGPVGNTGRQCDGGAGEDAERRRTMVPQRALVARLYRAMERRLAAIEERMTMSDDVSAADGERDARALGALVRAFEKLTEFDERLRASEATSDRTSDSKGGYPDEEGRAGDAERLRRDIARRIAALGGEGDA